jgi:hypothetical protein
MKNSIIERLLDQGHCTAHMADQILNNKTNKVGIISSLKHDDVITSSEVITLLKDNWDVPIPVGIPNQTQIGILSPDWSYDPNRPGMPSWSISCTCDLNKNFTDK